MTSVQAGRASSAGPALDELVDGLRRIGRSTVVLDLRSVQVADPIGLQLQHDVSVTMADAGNGPRLLDAPDDESGRPDGSLRL